MINISICLSDLPKESLKKAKNGKIYVNLCIAERKEVGKYDETHTVYVSQTSEERQSGKPTVFVGSGKEYIPRSVTPEDIEKMPPVQDGDDLPF
jgi:hypothetical protein